MHWVEAAARSPLRTAWRKDADGRLMHRRSDGSGLVQTKQSYRKGHEAMVPAYASELEGHMDWEPLEVDDAKGRQ